MCTCSPHPRPRPRPRPRPQVLVGAHAVLANGGVIAPVGMHMVALAAKQHSIPFVVLVGLHKMSPLLPHDSDLQVYNGERYCGTSGTRGGGGGRACHVVTPCLGCQRRSGGWLCGCLRPSKAA